MGRLFFDNTFSPTRFEHLDDGGRIVWRSDAPPALLLSSASTLRYSGNMVFPDLIKGNAMYYGWNGVTGGSALYQGGSFNVYRPGFWGPDAPSPRNIPRVTIGTVPKDCNYLDVNVNITQTAGNAYYFFFGLIYIHQKQGQSIDLDGGCVELEGAFCFRRIMKIVLSPTVNPDGLTRNVYLELYQSVKSNANWVTGFGTMKSGVQSYDGSATSAWQNLWTNDGDTTGWLGTNLATTGNDIHSMRGGSGAPSTADPTTYTSTWSIAATVRPGIVHT